MLFWLDVYVLYLQSLNRRTINTRSIKRTRLVRLRHISLKNVGCTLGSNFTSRRLYCDTWRNTGSWIVQCLGLHSDAVDNNAMGRSRLQPSKPPFSSFLGLPLYDWDYYYRNQFNFIAMSPLSCPAMHCPILTPHHRVSLELSAITNINFSR